MSGSDIDPPDPAAEYVLGTLDAAEADAAQARIAADPGFAAAVRAWEGRLTPLTLLVTPVPPPEALWDRVQASCALDVPAPANENRPGWWRGTAIASLAVAAGLAAFIVLHPAPAPVFAVLTPMSIFPSTMGPTGIGGTFQMCQSQCVVETDGKNTPRNLPNATATAAMVPVWMTMNSVHP